MSDFDVNGKRIELDGKTALTIEQHGTGSTEFLRPVAFASQLHLGVPLDIYGNPDRKNHAIKAYQVEIRQRRSREVSGTAVVEAVSTDSSNADKFLKADGYTVRLTPATKVTFIAPLKSSQDIQPDTVMDYQGEQEADGTVDAKQIALSQNKVSEPLKKLREDWDYDPHSVPDHSKQSGWSKGFRGIDPSMFPLRNDPAAQQRVETIGNKLIPAFQKAVAGSDETHINFRFYVVDASPIRDAFALPSGLILLPYNVLDRLQNDSQVAAVIADKIAELMEQQPIPLPATNKQLAASYGADAAALVIPFGGLAYGAVGIPMGVAEHKLLRRNQEQRARVALSLLHNAGFDLTEAPKAWWILASRKPKDIASTKPPDTSLYMYEVFGTTWAPSLH